MKVLKQLQNLQLPVKLKGSQCQGVMVTVGNGCSHVAGSSQLCPDSPASATPQNQNKSATGSEPAHSNQHVLNTRRQLRYSHPWYYSGVKCTASGSNPHPLAHAHAFACCDSSGWGFR